MKRMLFFFIIGFLISPLCSEKVHHVASINSGFEFNTLYYNLRFFSEYNAQQKYKNSWGFRLRPVKNVVFSAGNITFSGIWSRFINPAFLAMLPIRENNFRKQGLITALPQSDIQSKKYSIASTAKIQNIQAQSFISFNEKNTLMDTQSTIQAIGAGITIPIEIKQRFLLIPNGLKITVNLAWQAQNAVFDQSKMWYLESPFFSPLKTQTIIQETSIKGKVNNFLLGTGLHINPYKKISWFVYNEYILKTLLFNLQIRVFFRNQQMLFLNQTNIETLGQLNIQPQITIVFKKWTIKLGLAWNTKVLEERRPLTLHYNWINRSAVACDVMYDFISWGIRAEIDNIVFKNINDTVYPLLNKDSILKINSDFMIKNPLQVPIQTEITFHYEQNMYITSKNGSFFITYGIKTNPLFLKKPNITLFFKAQNNFKIYSAKQTQKSVKALIRPSTSYYDLGMQINPKFVKFKFYSRFYVTKTQLTKITQNISAIFTF